MTKKIIGILMLIPGLILVPTSIWGIAVSVRMFSHDDIQTSFALGYLVSQLFFAASAFFLIKYGIKFVATKKVVAPVRK